MKITVSKRAASLIAFLIFMVGISVVLVVFIMKTNNTPQVSTPRVQERTQRLISDIPLSISLPVYLLVCGVCIAVAWRARDVSLLVKANEKAIPKMAQAVALSMWCVEEWVSEKDGSPLVLLRQTSFGQTIAFCVGKDHQDVEKVRHLKPGNIVGLDFVPEPLKGGIGLTKHLTITSVS